MTSICQKCSILDFSHADSKRTDISNCVLCNYENENTYPMITELCQTYHIQSLVYCNRNHLNAFLGIEKGQYYILILPESNTVLYVICECKALRAADMKIIAAMRNNHFMTTDRMIGCYISYKFEYFDKIYLNSYENTETCLLYLVQK